MPFKPKKPCSHSGCPNLTSSRFCVEHERLDKQKAKEYDRERDQTEARQWIHSLRWRKASRMFLNEHPICVWCWAKDRDTPATLVDHIKPHNGNYDLFWDQNNWQGLCNPHHEEKHREDRWGR